MDNLGKKHILELKKCITGKKHYFFLVLQG